MSLVLYQVKDNIAYITLNRPEKRNALSAELVSELKASFEQANQDNSVKIIILQANGSAFCAGADLAYLQQLQKFSYEENLADSNHLKELFELIYYLPKVVIAKVQGSALAGGCGLATVADFTFAVPEAMFGYTEVRIGFVPAIVMVFLLRKIGETQAKNLLLSGSLISAQTAKNIGLIHEVTDAMLLDNTVENFAKNLIQQNSAQAMGLTKQLIAQMQGITTQQALVLATQANAHARSTLDCQRGIAAFLNKEKIVW
ncbi:MAG: enoyl-CoA hydratase-related protein [Microscillaceae bacterium]|nr:enoyl-CoA hydratase-related protein [Microscillaceae bacterium]MDW8461408.1 enoyl-CoA hydratase-related protein [Cytophagales bacterium]